VAAAGQVTGTAASCCSISSGGPAGRSGSPAVLVAEPLEQGPLLGGLDAFGHRVEGERGGHLADGGGDRGLPPDRGDRLDERSVELETAPTASADAEAPGDSTVPVSLPELPAATTNSAVFGAERVDRLRQQVRAVAGIRAAEAHVHDLRPRRGPLHAGQDGGVGTPAEAVENLAVEQGRLRRDAGVRAAGTGTGAGEDRGHVRPVAGAVVGVALTGEVGLLGDPAREIRVLVVDAAVDAAVEDGDRHAGAGQAAPARDRATDPRH
jgi:hypothetical protein